MDKKISTELRLDSITQVKILFSQLIQLYPNTSEYFGFELKKIELISKSSKFIKRNVGIESRQTHKSLQPSKKYQDRRPKSFKGNHFKGYRSGDFVEEISTGLKYFVSGVTSKTSLVLKDGLKTWKTVKSIVPKNLKLIHSFGSLSVEEIKN